jgi:hypothetical protein
MVAAGGEGEEPIRSKTYRAEREVTMSNETTNTQLAVIGQETAIGFFDATNFAHIQRVAKVFNNSQLVPEHFRGEVNFGNCVIALEMAQRMNASPMAVMQHLYIVHGKPGWSSQFIISCINSCRRFEPMRFDVTGAGDDRTCVAWTTEKGTKIPQGIHTLAEAKANKMPVLEGPPCSIGMAKNEGWHGKNGSKWKTMPDLMLHYRAATFFGRLYAPELLMGMRTAEEVIDVDLPEKNVTPTTEKPTFKSETATTPTTTPAKETLL